MIRNSILPIGDEEMEWIIRLNQAINYIEEHVRDEIDMNEVARIAGCSTYHFQRMFTYMANIPLSEYIRRRKMSLAAVDLQSGEKRVVDIALEYGYDSPTAFNRAFKSIHGVVPSQVKEDGVVVKAYPPIRFQMTIKGDCEMNYRIETKEAFRIVGVSAPLDKEIEKNFEVVPQMWGKAAMDGTIPKLAAMMNTQMKGLLGVSACHDQEQWKYYIAVASTLEITEPFEEYEVPATTWAIFEGEGTNITLQDLERRIVTEWLPTSGYEYGNAPDIEVYLNPDPENAVFEVWIPVVKNN